MAESKAPGQNGRPHRETQARLTGKGEVARSRLNTVAVTLAGAGGLLAFGGHGRNLLALMRMNFSLTRDHRGRAGDGRVSAGLGQDGHLGRSRC